MPFLTKERSARLNLDPWPQHPPTKGWWSHGAKKWFGQFSRHFTPFLEDKEEKEEKEGKEEKEYKEETEEKEEKQ